MIRKTYFQILVPPPLLHPEIWLEVVSFFDILYLCSRSIDFLEIFRRPGYCCWPSAVIFSNFFAPFFCVYRTSPYVWRVVSVFFDSSFWEMLSKMGNGTKYFSVWNVEYHDQFFIHWPPRTAAPDAVGALNLDFQLTPFWRPLRKFYKRLFFCKFVQRTTVAGEEKILSQNRRFSGKKTWLKWVFLILQGEAPI